ncbi:MAG: hypothetical protein ACAI35_16135, partial [Candidatus Methylacidiphilales bacterium]|nr:hypothetical protein [Candidatus Methylacidiphilales bacterium]
WIPSEMYFRDVREPYLEERGNKDVFEKSLVREPIFFSSYLVKDGRLYLRYMVRTNSILLPIGFFYLTWTPESVESLRKAHPELESMWPDPSARNGGVPWIK